GGDLAEGVEAPGEIPRAAGDDRLAGRAGALRRVASFLPLDPSEPVRGRERRVLSTPRRVVPCRSTGRDGRLTGSLEGDALLAPAGARPGSAHGRSRPGRGSGPQCGAG